MVKGLQSNWEQRAAVCTERWGLSNLKWLPDVSTAHVGFCMSPRGEAVLKVSIAPEMVLHEASALEHFGSAICPQVFGVALDLDALLIERFDIIEDLSAIYPYPRHEIDVWLPIFDAVRTRTEIPDGFPDLAQYSEVFDRVLKMQVRPGVAKLMRYGRDHKHILLGAPEENRLLHGDMHHFNILRDRAGHWKPIDPHGVIGHPLYELGAFLRNPWGACCAEPGVMDRLAARAELLAERLLIPVGVVAEYGFYGAAFSVAWSLEEESDDYDGMVVMSEALLSLVT